MIVCLLLYVKVCSSDINLRQFQTCGIDFNSYMFFIYSLIISSCSGLFSQWQQINMTVVTVHFAYFGGGGRENLASFSSF